MVNYYEILEVSEKASKEVIEKAYKALAKKYHPDLNRDNPKEAESKMKLINEAFEVLMDDSKRANFDHVLAKKKELEFRKQMKSNTSQNSSQNFNSSTGNNVKKDIPNAHKVSYSNNGYYTDNDWNFYVNTYNMDEKTKKKLQSKMQERYLEAYDAYLRQHGYKLKYRWTFKRVFQVILAILIAIVIFVILFFIPPIHDYFVNLYNENEILKILVDLVISFFQAIFSVF